MTNQGNKVSHMFHCEGQCVLSRELLCLAVISDSLSYRLISLMLPCFFFNNISRANSLYQQPVELFHLVVVTQHYASFTGPLS